MTSGPGELIRISADEERTLIVDVLTHLGGTDDEAIDQASMLVEGDLRGRPSHGVQRLPVIADRIRAGLLRPQAEVTASWVADAMLEVDGGLGFGPHVALGAARQIAERAKRTGVAAAAIRRASHLGMLAPYVEWLAERNMIALAFTSTESLVHPWGGRVPMVGTNPIALALPTTHMPFVLDMATGAISKGEVIARRARGQLIPENAAVDYEGRPTTDAAAADLGAISPFGGAKGFALGLGVGLLVAALTETALGTEVTGTLDTTHPVTKGDLMIVFDPAAAGLEAIDARIGLYLDALRASAPGPASSGVVIPGDRSRVERERRLSEGISIPTALWRELQQLRDDVEPRRSAHV